VAGPLLREHTTGAMWSGMALGLVGVAIVVSGDLAVSGAPWWAYLLPSAGMLCLTTGTVLARRLPTPEGVLETVMMQAVVTALVLCVLAVVSGRATVPTAWDFWAAVLWLIVLASLAGYGIYVHVARTQGATVVSTLLYLTPPTTMVWSWLMFGTPLTLVGGAGLAVSAVGVALVLRGRQVRQRVPMEALRRT
jgi:drug/metabolite transporter (DMT)-like permease